MNAMNSIPIDWANVNWVYVAVLAIFVFVATLIGNLLVAEPPRYRRLAVGDAVCRRLRLLDLLSARAAAADLVAQKPAVDRSPAGCAAARGSGQAVQPGHRHHAAGQCALGQLSAFRRGESPCKSLPAWEE